MIFSIDKQKYTWVVGRYEGEDAKRIGESAGVGIGYKIIASEGVGARRTIVAAFVFPTMRPIPQHLEEVTDVKKLNMLESWLHSGAE